MGLVREVNTAQFQSQAFRFERCMDPTSRVALVKHISHRRQVDQVYAGGVLLHFPSERMAIDVGLDLLTRPDDFKKSQRVLEPQVPANAGIMMDEHQRWLIAVCVE